MRDDHIHFGGGSLRLMMSSQHAYNVDDVRQCMPKCAVGGSDKLCNSITLILTRVRAFNVNTILNATEGKLFLYRYISYIQVDNYTQMYIYFRTKTKLHFMKRLNKSLQYFS